MRSAPAAGSTPVFHVKGHSVNFLIDWGLRAAALKRLGIARDDIGSHPDHAFPRRSFWRLPFLLLDAQFTRRTRPAVDRRADRHRNAALAADGNSVRAFFKTKQRFDLSVVALQPEESRTFGAVKVTPFPVVHGESGGPFLAYRIEAEGRVITYSAIPNGRSADSGCARRRPVHRRSLLLRQNRQDHLSLTTLEAQLPEIKAKKLILTHMSDDMLGRLGSLPYTTANDGMIIEL